jgi:hypothetical protein
MTRPNQPKPRARRNYEPPRILEDEKAFEREALATCSQKVPACLPNPVAS